MYLSTQEVRNIGVVRSTNNEKFLTHLTHPEHALAARSTLCPNEGKDTTKTHHIRNSTTYTTRQTKYTEKNTFQMSTALFAALMIGGTNYNIGAIDDSVPVGIGIQVSDTGESATVNWTVGVPPQSPHAWYWKVGTDVTARLKATATATFFAIGNPSYRLSSTLSGLEPNASYLVYVSDYDKAQNYRIRSAMSQRIPFVARADAFVGTHWMFPGKPDKPGYYDWSRTPQQQHLSMIDATSMALTWTQAFPPDSAYVTAWPLTKGRWDEPAAVNFSVTSVANLTYDASQPANCCGARWIVIAVMTKLTPGVRYAYTATAVYNGMGGFFAAPATFTMFDDRLAPRVAFVGDFGLYDGLVAPELTRLVNDDAIDMIIHVGDIAYNLPDQGGKVGDRFMAGIVPCASQVPYMVAPGNHDTGGPTGNFSDYTTRFAMPDFATQKSLFWSLDVGNVHFVAFNSEALFSYKAGEDEHYATQYNWLDKDLTDNKNKWVVAFAHRPMYCGYSGYTDCESELPRLSSRRGVNVSGEWQFGLEDLFQRHKVDVVITGHVHTYERFWPTYNWESGNGTVSPYTNPTAPVHIISGASGTAEGCDPFDGVDSVTGKVVWPGWPSQGGLNISAFKTDARGYGILKASAQQITWDQTECGWLTCDAVPYDTIDIIKN